MKTNKNNSTKKSDPRNSFSDFVKDYFPVSDSDLSQHHLKVIDEIHSKVEHLINTDNLPLYIPSRLHDADNTEKPTLKGINIRHTIMDDLKETTTRVDKGKVYSFIDMTLGNKPFKAFIRVVKSLIEENGYYGSKNIIREPLIYAKDKTEVKSILLEKYPQFFQNNKVYEKESKKDKAQFFYVVIYPLYNYEIQLIEEGEWKCSYCGQIHENKYLSPPAKNERLFGSDILFCKSDDDTCKQRYINEKYNVSNNGEIPDDLHYLKKDSLNYIYKITEKQTNKSYVGKTKNAPFFRWWNHLVHSSSPFGLYLRKTKLSDWTFEVLEELPYTLPYMDVLKIESEYIVKYDCINNGFNSIISNKDVIKDTMPKLF